MSLGCRRGGGGRYKCGSGCGCPSSDIPAYSQQVVRPIPTLADVQERATAGHFGRLPGFLNLHTLPVKQLKKELFQLFSSLGAVIEAC